MNALNATAITKDTWEKSWNCRLEWQQDIGAFAFWTQEYSHIGNNEVDVSYRTDIKNAASTGLVSLLIRLAQNSAFTAFMPPKAMNYSFFVSACLEVAAQLSVSAL